MAAIALCALALASTGVSHALKKVFASTLEVVLEKGEVSLDDDTDSGLAQELLRLYDAIEKLLGGVPTSDEVRHALEPEVESAQAQPIEVRLGSWLREAGLPAASMNVDKICRDAELVGSGPRSREVAALRRRVEAYRVLLEDLGNHIHSAANAEFSSLAEAGRVRWCEKPEWEELRMDRHPPAYRFGEKDVMYAVKEMLPRFRAARELQAFLRTQLVFELLTFARSSGNIVEARAVEIQRSLERILDNG